jgi:hypothetical protein
VELIPDSTIYSGLEHSSQGLWQQLNNVNAGHGFLVDQIKVFSMFLASGTF